MLVANCFRFAVFYCELFASMVLGTYSIARISITGQVNLKKQITHRAEKPSPVLLLKDYQKPVNALCWSPDGKYIATVSDDGTGLVWNNADSDLSKVSQIHAVESNNGLPLKAVTWSSDGTLAAFAGRDGIVFLTEPAPLTAFAFFKRIRREESIGPTSPISALAWCPGSELLAAGCRDGAVRVWNTSSTAVAATLRGHGAPVLALAFAPGGGLLASGDRAGCARVWDLATEAVARTIYSGGGAGGVTALEWRPSPGPDGETLAVLWSEGSLDLHLRPAGPGITSEPDRPARCLEVEIDPSRRPKKMSFSPDGRLLAAPSGEKVLVWDLRADSDEPRWTLTGHSGQVLTAAFSPDGALLGSASRDCTARVWA